MICGDIVANLQNQFRLQIIFKRLALGEFFDIGAAEHFRCLGLFHRQWC